MMSSDIQPELNAPPTPSINPVVRYVYGLWRNSRLSQKISTRVLKFILVGGSGVLLNLVVMALFLRLIGWRDWRVSAIANIIATLSNYLLNNHWTFQDRRRTGVALTTGAFLYMLTSAAGIAFTTASYGFLTKIHFRGGPMTSYIQLMGMQLIAVLAGAYFNYFIHTSFTWRESVPVGRDRSECGNIQAGAIPGYADSRNRTLKSFSSSSNGPSAVVLPE